MPKLTRNLTPDEFRQYYFLKEELKDFCRSEGLKVSGSKENLEKRIIHYLTTGGELAEPKTTQNSAASPTEITLDSRLGENFRCSQDRREFFVNEIGSTFKFNVRFQKWLKANPDRTYRDAVDAYFEIQKSTEKTEIGNQFQYNQYVRDFFKDNKGKTLDDAIRCWKYKKALKGHNRYEKSDLEALM
jgi:hypothetical protein